MSRMLRAGALLAAVALPLAPVSAAVAADHDHLQLSRDGITWSESLPTAPLLQPDLEWRPGDVRLATFRVRNTDAQAADVDVVITRPAAPGALAGGYLSLSVRSGSGSYTIHTAEDARLVVPLRDLAPGASTEITLRGALNVGAPAPMLVPRDALEFSVALADPPRSGGNPVARVTTAHLELIPLFLLCALLVAAVVARSGRRARKRAEARAEADTADVADAAGAGDDAGSTSIPG